MMMPKPRLSVIIITKNEAQHIHDCLASVQFADEIIVVDSGSIDATVALCQPFTSHVYVHDWAGFGVQKNRALSYATGDWVLSIDADERVSPALQAQILSTLQHSQHNALYIPRTSSYCGRFIHHSGWSPDYVLRLFRRHCAQFSDDLVHEKLLLTSGSSDKLTEALIHYSFATLDDVLDKVNRYSSAGAQMKFAQGKKASLGTAITHGLWAFIRTYFLQRGFLDGREGFILAVSNAEGTYYRYLKLMYLQEHYASTQH